MAVLGLTISITKFHIDTLDNVDNVRIPRAIHIRVCVRAGGALYRRHGAEGDVNRRYDIEDPQFFAPAIGRFTVTRTGTARG